jgi:hypothetical protein
VILNLSACMFAQLAQSFTLALADEARLDA